MKKETKPVDSWDILSRQMIEVANEIEGLEYTAKGDVTRSSIRYIYKMLRHLVKMVDGIKKA